MYQLANYEPSEEKFNIISHGLGLFLSFIGLIFLCVRAFEIGGLRHIIGFSVFGLSMVILYTASTFYHGTKDPKIRWRWNTIDRAAIYVMIAGSYTPFTLITLQGAIGWWLFAIVWSIALAGIFVKLFSKKEYELLSVISYLVMGWMAIFALKSLIQNLPPAGLYWLLAGGLFYMIGVAFYLSERVRFNHAIWHVFVLLGSASHYVTVYSYVI